MRESCLHPACLLLRRHHSKNPDFGHRPRQVTLPEMRHEQESADCCLLQSRCEVA